MSDKSNKAKGIAGTITVHLLVLLLLFLMAFSTPLPLPGGGEIMINFGTDDEGSGSIEPKKDVVKESFVKPQQIVDKGKEEPLTQDYEDAPAIKKKKEEVKKERKKEVVKTTPDKTQQQEKVTKTEEVKKEVNKKALFPGQKTDGGTTGEGETDKQGNQGSKDGSVDSQSHKGGTGDGQGGGEGRGVGVSFDLGGRDTLYVPKPDYKWQKSGTVVVEVFVDKSGRVTKVRGGAKGSTTTDTDLVKSAERAALKAKFDVSADASVSQRGTITYVFKLN